MHDLGKRALLVDIEDIDFLRGLHFSWTNSSGISCSTLYRRLKEEGISHETRCSDFCQSLRSGIFACRVF